MDTTWPPPAPMGEELKNDTPEVEIEILPETTPSADIVDTAENTIGHAACVAETTATLSKTSEIIEETRAEINPTATDRETTEQETPPAFEEKEAEMAGEREPADFDALATHDLLTLKAAFPTETATLNSLFELPDPQLFGIFRESGLSPEEAYRAMKTALNRRSSADDNGKNHLRHSVIPRGNVASGSGISYREMQDARALFPNLSPGELISLYKRVKNEDHSRSNIF